MHRRTLLLDAMGTLLTLQAPAERLCSVLRERLGVEVSVAQAHTALAAEIAHYRSHMDEARDERSLRELRLRCAIVLRDALPPLPRVAAAEPETMTGVLLAALRFSAFPDARCLLQRARAVGARTIVVSNWDVSLADVLGHVGLAPLIDAVVVSAVVGAAKPSPVIFARALELAGAPPADCLHVGDSPREDVAGARAAGIEAVLLDRGGRRSGSGGGGSGFGRDGSAGGGVRVIASLDELSL